MSIFKRCAGRALQLYVVFTYNSIVNGLCKSGNIAQAEKLMEEMQVAGPLTLVVIYLFIGQYGHVTSIYVLCILNPTEICLLQFVGQGNLVCLW